MTALILDVILEKIPIGSKLEPDYQATGVRPSRGERALFYSIPSKNAAKPSQKSIVESEFQKAFRELVDEGEFSLAWFKKNMPKTASQSTSCSFRVVGEVFVLLGLAKRVKRGKGHAYVTL